MATNKQTTVNEASKVDGKQTNPRKIVWPHDPYGITSMLKKEGVRAVGRIKGDPKKLDVFLGVLRALVDHSRVKTDAQRVAIAQALAVIEARQEALYARSLADQKREVERLKGLLASAEAAVAAKEAMPGEGE